MNSDMAPLTKRLGRDTPQGSIKGVFTVAAYSVGDFEDVVALSDRIETKLHIVNEMDVHKIPYGI